MTMVKGFEDVSENELMEMVGGLSPVIVAKQKEREREQAVRDMHRQIYGEEGLKPLTSINPVGIIVGGAVPVVLKTLAKVIGVNPENTKRERANPVDISKPLPGTKGS